MPLEHDELPANHAAHERAPERQGHDERADRVWASRSRTVHVNVSSSRIAAVLRERGLDVRTQSRASSHVTMRSLHPNHVHQVDASLCLVYYLNGEQRVIRDDELYKNKLAALAKVKFKCYRWVLTDHTSSVIIPWYTEAAGEDQFSLAEFLLFAWSEQDGRPFHGVPEIVIWDKGSANQAHAVKALLRALEVKDIAHATGNSRAKGQVECAQNIVEKEFESRLRLEPVERWPSSTRRLRLVQRLQRESDPEAGHARPPRARAPGALRSVDAHPREQLRYLPDADLCRALLAGREETRKVMGNLQITFKHPARPSTSLATTCATWRASPSATTSTCSRCSTATARSSSRSHPSTDRAASGSSSRSAITTRHGFRESAPVFGESFKANPQTPSRPSAARSIAQAYGDKPLEEIEKDKRKNARPSAAWSMRTRTFPT
jgi:hypothetical protein